MINFVDPRFIDGVSPGEPRFIDGVTVFLSDVMSVEGKELRRLPIYRWGQSR